ncbi:hypothetical protein G9A89_023386 [Geosiphon pyriformis]|nr:hypothetical protein G9A89_023386 [Geosiphon pyriformis]
MVPYVVDGLNPDPLIQVAEIFQNGFLALKKSIYSNLKFLFTIRKKEGLKIIHFTGWGIGGALAVIAAITFQLESYIKNSNFDVRVTTFGAPRIGNTYFARLINKFLDIQRFTYFNDHVPHFPKRDSIPNDILTHHELELWIIPEKLCDCPTEFRIVRCPGFDYKKKAPRQIGVSNDTFFPHRVMSGENQECNAGQSITNVRVDFVHVGPYFGKIMNDCTGVLGSR